MRNTGPGTSQRSITEFAQIGLTRRSVLHGGTIFSGLGISAQIAREAIISNPPEMVRYLTPEQVREPGDSDWQMLQRLADRLGDRVGARIDKDYVIDHQIEIIGKSRFSIIGNGHILIDAGVPATYGHSIFYFAGCSDFLVEGLTCDGNRSNRAPTEASGHLVVLDACHRWTLRRVRAINGTTDGFLVCTSAGQGTGAAHAVRLADIPSEWIMQDCEAINNFRQGLTIAESLNWKVIGGTYAKTHGLLDVAGATGPCAGIDLEPDHISHYPQHRLRFGIIDAVTFSGNQGPGLLISSVDGVSDIVVVRCRFFDNGKSAIECTARNVRIVSPEIRGWDDKPYSSRSDVPQKRGLIDIGSGGGPDITIISPRFFDIRMPSDSPLPLIYVHGDSNRGIQIQQVSTDGSAAVIAHLLAAGSVFKNSVIRIAQGGQRPAFAITGTNAQFRNNIIRNISGMVIDCSAKRPGFFGNVFQVEGYKPGQAVIDCSLGQEGQFVDNQFRRAKSGYALDLKLPRGAIVTGNSSLGNLSARWIEAPVPRVFKGNRLLSR